MKVIILMFNVLLFSIYSNAQLLSSFPGEKSKEPFTCEVDNSVYNIGDFLTIGTPSNKSNYNNIIMYAPLNTFYNIEHYSLLSCDQELFGYKRVLTEAFETRYKYANKDIEGFRGKIDRFKIKEFRGILTTFAIIRYRGNVKIAVAISNAIDSREVRSKNNNFERDFIDLKLKKASKNTNEVISFDSNYQIEFIRCYGDKSDQTVTLEFSMRHGLVNQSVSIYSTYIKAYDFNGNTYKSRNVKLGNSSSTSVIPTGVKVNGSLQIKEILPEVKILSTVDADVFYRNEKGSNNEKRRLKFNNVEIDWDYLDSINKVQSELEKIRIENLYTSEITARDGVVIDDLSFKLLGVQGNVSQQSVEIEWLVENKGINIDVFYTSVEAIIDNLGNEILLNEAYYGATKVSMSDWNRTSKKLIRNVPIKIKYKYIGVPPESTSIKFFEIPFYYHNIGKSSSDFVKDKIMLKELNINWK